MNDRRKKLSTSLSPPDPHGGTLLSLVLFFPTCLTAFFKRKEHGNFMNWQLRQKHYLSIRFVLTVSRTMHAHKKGFWVSGQKGNPMRQQTKRKYQRGSACNEFNHILYTIVFTYQRFGSNSTATVYILITSFSVSMKNNCLHVLWPLEEISGT